MFNVYTLLRAILLLMFISGSVMWHPAIAQTGCAPDGSPGTTNAWLNNYSRQSNYVPGSELNLTPTALKTIDVAVHVFQRSVGQGFSNFNGPNIVDDFQEVMNIINSDYFAGVDEPSDPVMGYVYLSDTKVRVNLVGVEFYRDTDLWNILACTNNPEEKAALINAATTGVNDIGLDRSRYKSVLNIFVVKNSGCSGIQGQSSSFRINSMQEDIAAGYVITKGANSTNVLVEFYARHLAHEIGHNLGLLHTYAPCNDAENLRFDNPDFLFDVFGMSQIWCGTGTIQCSWGANNLCYFSDASGCDPYANLEIPFGSGNFFNDNCTNNIMGNNEDSRFTSPLQMGRMHRTLMTCNTAKYAWGYDPQHYVVQQDETWDFRIKFYQDIVIPDGVTLTVNCEVHMVPEASVIVEPGGRLILDGGTLKAATFAPAPWQGVKVLGNASLSQAVGNQGFLSLMNGAVIEGAITGVFVGDPDDVTAGGGEVRIAGTADTPGGTIKNCRTGIYFRPYSHYPYPTIMPGYVANNRSLFQHAQFAFDGTGFFSEQGLNAHVVMDGVNNVLFEGCLFENSAQDVAESHLLGHGIKAIGSRFRVRPACATPPTGCGPTESVPTRFVGLDHGIHALGEFMTSSFSVERSEFLNNICGVYVNGVPGFTVRNNTFEIGERDTELTGDVDDQFSDRHRGIFATNSFAFRIEDNVLGMTNDPQVEAEGIVVGYTRDHNDAVLRNEASGMKHAFVGEGISASIQPGYTETVGLQFLCNENEGNETNIWSRRITDEDDADLHTIRALQGASTRGADNIFDGWGSEPDHWDYNVTTQFSTITYFHRPLAGHDPEAHPAELLPIAVGSVTPGACAPLYQKPTAPSQLITVVGPYLEEARLAFGNVRYQYEQLIDGGNTDEVVQEIVAAWPQDLWELRDYLLSRSPYLTTEVLRNLINKPSVPDAVKLEVCIANPEATQRERFIQWVQDSANYPLPEYLLGMLIASWDQRTYRTSLEGAMADHHYRMTYAANDLLEHYTHADSIGSSLDSVQWVWNRLRTPAARYAEAQLLLERGHFTEASAVIQTLGSEHKLKSKELVERGRMLTLIDLLAGLQQNGRTIRDLDNAEVANAKAFIDVQYDRPGVWMSNVLCFHYKHCLPPRTGGDGDGPKALPRANTSSTTPPPSSLRLHPNPTQAWVAVDYDLQPNAANAQLLVKDGTGRVIQSQRLSAPRGQVVLDTRPWAKGLYTLELVQDGQRTQVEKLVVQ